MATHSCLENPSDRGAWGGWCSPWGRRESDATEGLSQHCHVAVPFKNFTGVQLIRSACQSQECTEWLITHTCISAFSSSFPIYFTIEYSVDFPVLSIRPFLIIYLILNLLFTGVPLYNVVLALVVK